jgi:hypothetical protein
VGRSQFKANLDKSKKAYLKMTKAQRGWGCGSSDRVLAQEAPGPEFKFQSTKKKKKKPRDQSFKGL